jgi:tRNA-2-methylthio-N6-dimethylallyladenosine synthase
MLRKNRYYVETFGCQMNVNDSEKAAGLLEGEGYEACDSAEGADLVFINTCAVREKAAQKLYHSLGRLKRLKAARADLVIGVGGCVAQLEGERILERAPQVGVLLGTHNFGRLAELARRARQEGGSWVDLDRRADAFDVPDLSVAHSSAVRAYVTVMEGCNHVCSFCVVPRTRGPEVNRAPSAIVAEVASLVSRGFPEVMLLGQTVNAYRQDAVDFVRLLELVHDVSGLRRLRFTTSHPQHASERLARAFGELPRLCPYLHLPVQSGSDRILAAMRRGYTNGQYRETVARLREHSPGMALSSDVIVGYPGETERDFEATMRLVDDIGFDGLFVFLYSPRPGTTAFRQPDDVPKEEKHRRLRVLNDRQQRFQRERNRMRIGSSETVLIEKADGEGRLSGRTPHFRLVHLDGSAELVGQVVTVEVTGSGSNALMGRLAPSDSLTEGSRAPIF